MKTNFPFILYFNIDYEMYKEPLDENTAYFHASWHRENPCQGWGPDLQTNCPEVNNVTNFKGENNYTVLDVEGTGHYVGCNLTVNTTREAGGEKEMICSSLMERNTRH